MTVASRAAPRVLILSAPYGSGHLRAAEALARAFEAEGARPDVVDHFRRFVPPSFVRASLALFWGVIRWAPRLWGLTYRLSARIGPRSPAMGGMDRLGAAGLRAYLQATRPDVVVHVHPTPAAALAWLRARGEATVPHGLVFTDFLAHPQWIYAGLDRYFVPTDGVRAGVVAHGVPADRVVPSGIPIHPGFSLPLDRATLRAALALSPGVPAVLVTGGMRGVLGGIAEACEVLAGRPEPFAAVVLCGDDRRRTRLQARFDADRRFRILGRVEEMWRVMGAVDLVISKAGALTCAEALALARPLLCYRSLPGQEQANEEALVAAGAALRAGNRRELARHVGALLGDPALRSALSVAARACRRPDAARVVAKEMLAVAGAG